MDQKPTYEELEKRIVQLVNESKCTKDSLKRSECKLAEYANQMEQFSLSAASMISIKDEKIIFAKISQAIVEFSDFRRVIISLFKDEFPYREIIGHCGVSGELVEKIREIPLSKSWYDHVFSQGLHLGHFSYYIPQTMKHILNQEATIYGNGPTPVDSTAWHPEDNLFVRMNDENGHVIGVISVDDSKSGQRPSLETIRPLEIYASLISQIIVFKRAQANRELLGEQLKLAQKMESIGLLAGGIAHDFNNLLAAILGNINLALFDDSLNVSTKKLLSEVEKASLRAKDLVQQLLTFSKGGEPVKEVSSLEDVIKESASFVLSGDKVACTYDFPGDLWLVDIDKGQISQVIQNIVLNASHAMPNGGMIKISCKNTSSADKNSLHTKGKGKFVKICIQDTGIGISQEIIEKIFDPYYTTKSKGSGLGLAITQSIINKHKGEIFVESSPGNGSTFTIYLPASEKIKPHEQAVIRESRVSSQAKILIMDDEEMVRAVVKAMLVSIGHIIILAEGGDEAIELYTGALNSENPFDLVIMDLTIPGGMGGKEAVKRILDVNLEAKVIVSSGYSNDPIMANFKDYGFCAAIVKPFQLKELSRVVSDTLR